MDFFIYKNNNFIWTNIILNMVLLFVILEDRNHVLFCFYKYQSTIGDFFKCLVLYINFEKCILPTKIKDLAYLLYLKEVLVNIEKILFVHQ